MKQNGDLYDDVVKEDVFIFDYDNWVSLSQRILSKEQVLGSYLVVVVLLFRVYIYGDWKKQVVCGRECFCIIKIFGW